jgi:hypothetical protein
VAGKGEGEETRGEKRRAGERVRGIGEGVEE